MMLIKTGTLLRTASRSFRVAQRSVVTLGAYSSPVFSSPTTHTTRFFSDDSGSHSDFQAQRKANPDDAQATIAKHVKENPIMLYMKGKPSMALCGFSATVVSILKQENVPFGSVDVLEYPSIREGVKQFSDWPTIPQLYVNGEFIGGCDIVKEMHESGELKKLLAEAKKSGEGESSS